MTINGISQDEARRAIEGQNPFPGTRGFAGEIDGALIRDVLGRELIYIETEPKQGVGRKWAFDPGQLQEPELVPAGYRYSLTEEEQEQIWNLPNPDPVTERKTALAQLSTAIETAIADVDPAIPVAFSGGVDSAYLAAATEGPLYVCGFEGSKDIIAAKKAAATLNRNLKIIELTHEQLRDATVEVVNAIGRTNTMDVTIALPLYLTAKQVADDGFDQLLLGQGADELFGGYAKVANASNDPRVSATTIREARNEVLKTIPDQMERDMRAIKNASVTPICPYLDDRVVSAALELPEELLIADDQRKVGLRQIAETKLPEEVAYRDKKALQYGSYVSRELDRLARQEGYKRRIDNHVEKYIRHLISKEN